MTSSFLTIGINNGKWVAELHALGDPALPRNLQFPESLHQNTIQLLESKRGSAKNITHPGLPVDIAKLEQQIIQQLSVALLCGPIGEALIARQAALAEGESLQLVIRSEDSAIRNLPWEMLQGSPSLQQVTITRTMQPSQTAFDLQGIPAPTAAPLKLLFVTALPENLSERGKELQIEDEQRRLIEAVGNLEATGDRRPKMVIEFLDVASIDEIKAALKARRHDILHISGHGGFNEKINQAVLHLENEDGDHFPTEAKDFAEALRGHDSLRLVVLSACETAVIGPQGGMVEAVAAIGVPAVMGMRFTVGDAEAKLFTTHFYQHLANGAPIAKALGHARCELWNAAQEWKEAYPDHPRFGEWFTPMLYLNGAVGALVNLSLPYQLPADFYPRETEEKRLIGNGFIGRKRQLIHMRRAFQAGRHVCVVGMGGIGKTTLSEAFATNYDNGSHKVIFLQGKAGISQFSILEAIAITLGDAEIQKLSKKELKGYLKNGEIPFRNRLSFLLRHFNLESKVILILDNFEDLQSTFDDQFAHKIRDADFAAFLNHLMNTAPRNLKIILTTRYKIINLSKLVDYISIGKFTLAEQWRLINFSSTLQLIGMGYRGKVLTRLDGLPRAYEFLESIVRNQHATSSDLFEKILCEVEGEIYSDLMLNNNYGKLAFRRLGVVWIVETTLNFLENRDETLLQTIFLASSLFQERTPLRALSRMLSMPIIFLRKFMANLNGWSLCQWNPI